jgi:hypothetical protein
MVRHRQQTGLASAYCARAVRVAKPVEMNGNLMPSATPGSPLGGKGRDPWKFDH